MSVEESKRRWQMIDGHLVNTMGVLACEVNRPEPEESLTATSSRANDAEAECCSKCGRPMIGDA